MQKSREKPRKRREAATGLLANGCSGAWSIDVDDAGARLYAQLDSPHVYVYFELSGASVLAEMLKFLERTEVPANGAPSRPWDESHDLLRIGRFHRTPVELVRDRGLLDRYFLKLASPGPATVHVTLAGDDLVHFRKALRQVVADLQAE